MSQGEIMKYVSVFLGLMISSACSGEASQAADPADTQDPVAAPDVTGSPGAGGVDGVDPAGSVAGPSRFELLRVGAAGHGHDLGRNDVGATSPPVLRALAQGAARLAALQADTTGDNAGNGLVDTDPDDGGWDFILPQTATAHTAAASPGNLFGATGLGAWAAVQSGSAGNRILVATLDAGTGIQRDPEIDSPPDFVFGVALARLAENPGFAEVVRQRYDARRAANGGAVGFGTLIRDSRHASGNDGLIPYDLGWLTLGAAALDSAFPGAGYGADADTYAGLVVDDLQAATPRFDIRDATEDSYITGLAWAQVSAAWLDATGLLDQVRTRLLDQQKPTGAWGNSAAQPADDLQATAHALQTLAIAGRATVRSRLAERRAGDFLLRAQVANGGWPDASKIELPLVDADILLGLAMSQASIGVDNVVSASVEAPRAAPRATPWVTPVP
jgi:hypothetical protein